MQFTDMIMNYIMVDPLAAVATVLAIIAIIVAICSLRRVGRQKDISIMLNCLSQYSNVRNIRAQAMLTGSQPIAEMYYDHLFDLMWVEFRLWREGRIDDHTMKEWMATRSQDFTDDDSIVIVRSTQKGRAYYRVTYRGEWNKRQRKQASQFSNFVPFMNLVHEGSLEEAVSKSTKRKGLPAKSDLPPQEDPKDASKEQAKDQNPSTATPGQESPFSPPAAQPQDAVQPPSEQPIPPQAQVVSQPVPSGSIPMPVSQDAADNRMAVQVSPIASAFSEQPGQAVAYTPEGAPGVQVVVSGEPIRNDPFAPPMDRGNVAPSGQQTAQIVVPPPSTGVMQ